MNNNNIINKFKNLSIENTECSNAQNKKKHSSQLPKEFVGRMFFLTIGSQEGSTGQNNKDYSSKLSIETLAHIFSILLRTEQNTCARVNKHWYNAWKLVKQQEKENIASIFQFFQESLPENKQTQGFIDFGKHLSKETNFEKILKALPVSRQWIFYQLSKITDLAIKGENPALAIAQLAKLKKSFDNYKNELENDWLDVGVAQIEIENLDLDKIKKNFVSQCSDLSFKDEVTLLLKDLSVILSKMTKKTLIFELSKDQLEALLMIFNYALQYADFMNEEIFVDITNFLSEMDSERASTAFYFLLQKNITQATLEKVGLNAVKALLNDKKYKDANQLIQKIQNPNLRQVLQKYFDESKNKKNVHMDADYEGIGVQKKQRN